MLSLALSPAHRPRQRSDGRDRADFGQHPPAALAFFSIGDCDAHGHAWHIRQREAISGPDGFGAH
jgi:hypothetical protein